MLLSWLTVLTWNRVIWQLCDPEGTTHVVPASALFWRLVTRLRGRAEKGPDRTGFARRLAAIRAAPAEVLGVSYKTLLTKIKEFGL